MQFVDAEEGKSSFSTVQKLQSAYLKEELTSRSNSATSQVHKAQEEGIPVHCRKPVQQGEKRLHNLRIYGNIKNIKLF